MTSSPRAMQTLADPSAEITDLLLAEYGIRLAPVRLSRPSRRET